MSLDIKEAINESEERALSCLANRVMGKGATFVEIGSWKGHSASIIGEVAKAKEGHLYCVDHWKGNAETSNLGEAKSKDLYALFEHNLRSLELWEYITPLKMDSIEGSKTFEDGSIDFLFIDADHRYQPFREDLRAWTPKIKVGGIICGHDCEWSYCSRPELQGQIDSGLSLDYDGYYHPGIIRGLFDYFNDDYLIFGGTRIWWRVV